MLLLGATPASWLSGGDVYMFSSCFILCSFSVDNLEKAADVSKNDSYLQGKENGK